VRAGDEEQVMNARCNKTAGGREEIRARALPLSRPARNLLLIIDASKTAGEWLTLVHGATPADLDALAQHGLIEVVASGAPRPARPPVFETLSARFEALDFNTLYNLLTQQAKQRFGLIKGYKLVLDVEKCSNPSELHELGLRFLALVREEQGDAGLNEIAKALGLAA
jgi:hypothetical protein